LFFSAENNPLVLEKGLPVHVQEGQANPEPALA